MNIRTCRRCSDTFESARYLNLCPKCKSTCNRCGIHLTKENAYKYNSDVSQCKPCRGKVVLEFQIKSEGSTKAYHRKLNNRRFYYLNEADFERLRAEAKYKCEICGKKDFDKNLCVDHCHDTKAIRGYLCRTCNSAIGLLGDNSKGLRKALEYLERKETKPFKVPEFKEK